VPIRCSSIPRATVSALVFLSSKTHTETLRLLQSEMESDTTIAAATTSAVRRAIGAVLCATGILAGVGLGVIGIAVLMVAWGLIVAFFSRFRKDVNGRPAHSPDRTIRTPKDLLVFS